MRTADTYEFLVRDPWGASAISGYRRAARHFGLHTMEDSTLAGSDRYRLFVHKRAAALRRVVKMLEIAYASNQQDAIDEAEMSLYSAHVPWFAQDWKDWNAEQDEGALETLGWKRLMVKVENGYRVTLKLLKRRRPRGKV
jgi:hypothetical protein